MKSFRLAKGRRDSVRLSRSVFVGVALFVTGLYLVLLGYLFFAAANLVSALLIGVTALAFVKFVVPKLLWPVLGKDKHKAILDWGTKGLNRINLIFVVLASLARAFSLFETFLPNLEYTTTEDIIFTKVLPLVILSSFLYVSYLVIVSSFTRTNQ